MSREVYLVETQVASLKKKTAVATSWVSIDAKGQGVILDVDKYALMRRVQIHARDLRILDPMLSYPSAILGREKVIVLNLEVIFILFFFSFPLFIEMFNEADFVIVCFF